MKQVLVIIIMTAISTGTVISRMTVLSGRVIDSINHQSLIQANIRIENTLLGAVAGKDGMFILHKIKPGKYTLKISYTGYRTKRVPFEIKNGDSLYLEIALQEQALKTPDVVVTAGKRLQAVQDVPVTVSVIESETFNQRNIGNFDEALQYVPGLNMNGDQVNIRGSSGIAVGVGSRVALLLDGLPLVSGDNGDMKFDAIPVLNIERIEIIKGSGSALYGSGALGGVINIISKVPEDNLAVNLRTYSGIYSESSFDEWKIPGKTRMKNGADLSLSKRFGNFGFLISGSYSGDKSYRIFDESYKWNVFSKCKYSINDFSSLNLLCTFSSDDRDDWVYWNSLDSATYPPTSTNRNIRVYSGKFTASAEFRHIFNDDVFLSVKSNVFATRIENTWKPEDSDYRKSEAQSYNSEIQLNTRIVQNLMLSSGLCATYNDVNSNIYGNISQGIFSFYEQAEYSFSEGMTETAGFRYDYEKTESVEHSSQFSPKLGISYKVNGDFTLRLSVGKGFRTPAVAERFTSLKYYGLQVQPNLLLKPELSWSYEVGGDYLLNTDFAAFKFDLAIFRNEFSDLIEPVFIPSEPIPYIQFQNLMRARITGCEFALKAILFGFIRLESSLTYMEPVDLTINETLKYRPKILWYNSINFFIGMFDFQVDYRHIGKVDRIDTGLDIQINDSEARVPINVADARIIAHLNVLLGLDMSLSLNCKNIFNYYYSTTPGNIQPFRYTSLQAVVKL